MSYGQKTGADLISKLLSFLSLREACFWQNISFQAPTQQAGCITMTNYWYQRGIIKKILSNQSNTLKKHRKTGISRLWKSLKSKYFYKYGWKNSAILKSNHLQFLFHNSFIFGWNVNSSPSFENYIVVRF